jgi:predicted dehydrogenase
MPEVELTSVCDIDPSRQEEIGRMYPSVRVTDNLESALESVEAVVVATPVGSHEPVARAALERGIATLIEKPMALSVRGAEEIVALSEAKSVPVVVGHLLVFHPAVERLQTMIADGDLGSVYYLYSQRVNLGQVRPDENALWSFGPHDVSVAMKLLGEPPVYVSAQGRSCLQPGIEDVVFLNMEFASGIVAHVQMSWLDPHKERRLTVVGSRKMVVFDDMQAREKLKVYDKGVDRPPEYGSYGESLAVREGDIWIPRIPNVEPLRAELRHFVTVVRREERPRSSARDGLEIVRIMQAASDSLAHRGRQVELDHVRARA